MTIPVKMQHNKGDTEKKREVSRYHRDGLIFETISWAAAQQTTKGKALLRDPHIKSTNQGLDGLNFQLPCGIVVRVSV